MTQQASDDPNNPYPGPQAPPPGSDPNPPTQPRPCDMIVTIGNVQYKLVPLEEPAMEDITDTTQD